jgi:hypothetical protein
MEIMNKSANYHLSDAGKIIALILVAFLSGNLWIIISRSLFPGPRENSLANSHLGRTVIGLAWLALMMGIIYFLKFAGDLSVRNIIDVMIPAMVAGMFMQLIVFALSTYFGDGQ